MTSAPVQTTLVTAALLDSAGRFIANVGVPAAITFFLLAQLTPRLDTIASNQSQTNTQLAIIGASCGGSPRLADAPVKPSDPVLLAYYTQIGHRGRLYSN